MTQVKNWLGLNTLLLLFLLALPAAIILNMMGAGATLIFIAAAISIVPLAGMLGTATEAVAEKTGPRWGGLLNATLGNSTEIIISFFALKTGLVTVVLASLTGSILGNLLLVLGMALLAGGIKHGTQMFDRSNAKTDATLLIIVIIAMGIPSLFNASIEPIDGMAAEGVSIGTAVVMLVIYGLYLLYNMTNQEAIAEEAKREEASTPHWTMTHAGIVLVASVALIALLSEILVSAIEGFTETLGWSEFFIGIIIIPIVGNAAEHTVAITQALKNEMDLSLSIAIGSSLQIALFVAPLLVFISLLVGNPMKLEFDAFEIAAITAASIITAFVSQDGESNWLEGAMLLTVYVILAVGFFFL
jgi:Ca2+:H+ antiporter